MQAISVRLVLVAALSCLALLPVAGAHEGAHQGHGGARVDFPVPCTAPAQQAFNDAVTLLHHMTYPQARSGFEKVIAIDPGCAMAHWGVAMTLFQPLWPTRPGPEALQSGWDHVQKALALAPVGRERALIAATEAFYLDPQSSDYWLRIRRWEAASALAYQAYPADDEVAAFYALAHLATAPSNSASRKNADESAAILLKVYHDKPGHPGAMHYLVHANDVPGRERELLDIVRQYEAAAPDNPHALHMPTHIYTRLGEWDSVIRGNLRAADAALLFPAGEKGELVWDEFPHAIEYLVYAYLQQGADADALAQVQRLQGTPHLQPSFKTAFHLASTQARYALERKDWPQAAALVPGEPNVVDWSRFAWPEAIMQFAHGLGSTHVGKLQDADAAAARLGVLEEDTRKGGEDLFARNIQVLRLELQGWLAHARHEPTPALARLTEAAALESETPKHPVTPGPTLPARELLGDLLMEQGQPALALASYKIALQAYPNRFNSLLGAARAARATGDEAQARTHYRELIGVAQGATRTAPLDEARRYLSPASSPVGSEAPAAILLSRGFDVIGYATHLIPDVTAGTVRGSESIDLAVTNEAATQLEFDAGGLAIDALTMRGKAVGFTVSNGKLQLALPARVKPGTRLGIDIRYHGAPAYGLEFHAEAAQVYTVFSTSQWMVAVDAPDERATLDLSVELPEDYRAIGNGAEVSRKRAQGNRVIYRWKQVDPVPSFAYGFAAGRLDQFQDKSNGIDLRFLSRGLAEAQVRGLFANTGAMLGFFASRAGVPYGGKYDQALVTETIGQEAATFSMLSEAYGRSTLAGESSEELIAHEVAHQWWGIGTTCRTWGEFWLNEGFATFMAAAYMQHQHGDAEYLAAVDRWRKRVAKLRAEDKDHALVYERWDKPSRDDRAVVYQKGAYALHMLRQQMGEAAFWNGIREYSQRFANRAVTTVDFQGAMERSGGRSLDEFFNRWVAGIPADEKSD